MDWIFRGRADDMLSAQSPIPPKRAFIPYSIFHIPYFALCSFKLFIFPPESTRNCARCIRLFTRAFIVWFDEFSSSKEIQSFAIACEFAPSSPHRKLTQDMKFVEIKIHGQLVRLCAWVSEWARVHRIRRLLKRFGRRFYCRQHSLVPVPSDQCELFRLHCVLCLLWKCAPNAHRGPLTFGWLTD